MSSRTASFQAFPRTTLHFLVPTHPSGLKTDIISSKISPKSQQPTLGHFQEPLILTVITVLININLQTAMLACMSSPVDYKHYEGRNCVLFSVQNITSGLSINFATLQRGYKTLFWEACAFRRRHLTYFIIIKSLFLRFQGSLRLSPLFKTLNFTWSWDAGKRWLSSFNQNNILCDQCTFFSSSYTYFTTLKTMEAVPQSECRDGTTSKTPATKLHGNLHWKNSGMTSLSKTFYQTQYWLHFFFFFLIWKKRKCC